MPEEGTISVFSYEYVLEHGRNAAAWPFGNPRWKGIADAVADDERLSAFRAVQSGEVYHCHKGRLPGLANPFYTAVFVYPDQALADLAYIFHPEVLPGHQLRYFEKLKSN